MQLRFQINAMVLALLIGSTAQSQQSLPDAEKAKPLVIHPKALTPSAVVVESLDGASDAKAALNAMVAASDAGDVDAALLLVDPEIRPLLIPNIAVERYANDSAILERALFGKREFEPGGILFWFTRRDLVRIRSIKLLETRMINDQRVVLTVLTTEKSYHDDEQIHNIRQFLAVERSGRWYLFRPFGMLTHVLREVSLNNHEDEPMPMVDAKTSTQDSPNRENAEWEIQYHVPIEVIHECLIKTAKSPGFQKHGPLAHKLQRYMDSVEHRALRGDFSNRAALQRAMEPAERWAGELTKSNSALEPALRKLAEHQAKRPKTPGKD